MLPIPARISIVRLDKEARIGVCTPTIGYFRSQGCAAAVHPQDDDPGICATSVKWHLWISARRENAPGVAGRDTTTTPITTDGSKGGGDYGRRKVSAICYS